MRALRDRRVRQFWGEKFAEICRAKIAGEPHEDASMPELGARVSLLRRAAAAD